MVGVNEMTIVNMEKARTKPTRKNLGKIAGVFGICVAMDMPQTPSQRLQGPNIGITKFPEDHEAKCFSSSGHL